MSDDHLSWKCVKQSCMAIKSTESKIDLEAVGGKIESAGYTVGIRTRLAWTFSGPAELTLYPSGKLLVKTEDKELAANIARNMSKNG